MVLGSIHATESLISNATAALQQLPMPMFIMLAIFCLFAQVFAKDSEVFAQVFVQVSEEFAEVQLLHFTGQPFLKLCLPSPRQQLHWIFIMLAINLFHMFDHRCLD